LAEPTRSGNEDAGGGERVAVLGLGYTGLPLAISLAEAGLQVEGVDALESRVRELERGSSPIDDIDDERLQAALAGRLKVSTSEDAQLGNADVVFVCVPTPINSAKDPDLGPVLAAASQIRAHLRPGQLIVLQSTTYPGTTNGPFRESLERSGLAAGREFDLAFAPERINPGDPGSSATSVPRLVGGTTAAATERAARLLERISDQVIRMSSPDAAEMSKLLENVFRYVNIAFVNQLARLCERMQLDVWEVIDGASSKPFGFMRFTPGPGVGGHCIPVDSHYLLWRAREFDFVDRFIEAASDINAAMPRHVVDLVAEALNDRGLALKGSRVGILGVAFKPNIVDARNSPAKEIIARLLERGSEVRFHDPHVDAVTDTAGSEHHTSELEDLIEWADVVAILTAHEAIDWMTVFQRASLIVDTVNRSASMPVKRRQVLRLGAGWSQG
jgi:UDP-N-acetyl-D-glucosamine dehydrogenase